MVRRRRPEVITEWREVRSQLSGVANAFLSIVGAGVAVAVVGWKTAGWTFDIAVIVGVIVAVIVAIAETFLFGRDVYDAQRAQDSINK